MADLFIDKCELASFTIYYVIAYLYQVFGVYRRASGWNGELLVLYTRRILKVCLCNALNWNVVLYTR